MSDDYEVLDWSAHGVPADVEVRAWPMGMLTFHKGRHQATIDTSEMTQDEVVRSIAVALWQIDEQVKAARKGNGKADFRRQVKAHLNG